MHHILFEISNPVGLVGVILLLISYFYLSIGRWISHSLIYQNYNLLGALMILFSLYFHFNLSSFLIEFAWVVISLIGIYRILHPSRRVLRDALRAPQDSSSGQTDIRDRSP